MHACCLYLFLLPGPTVTQTPPEPTANEGEDNQKVWMVKKKNIFRSRIRSCLHLPSPYYVRNTKIRGYPTTGRTNTTTRKKCPPSVLLSRSASFDVSRVRSRGSCLYGCKRTQCLLYVRNQPPQSTRKPPQQNKNGIGGMSKKKRTPVVNSRGSIRHLTRHLLCARR